MTLETVLTIVTDGNFTSLADLADWLNAAKRGAIQERSDNAEVYAALYQLATEAENLDMTTIIEFQKFLRDNTENLEIKKVRLYLTIEPDVFPLLGDHLWSRYLTSTEGGQVVWQQREPGSLTV